MCACVRACGGFLAKVAGARLSPLMETARTATSFHRHTLTFRLAAASHPAISFTKIARWIRRAEMVIASLRLLLSAKPGSPRNGIRSIASDSSRLSLSLCVRTCVLVWNRGHRDRDDFCCSSGWLQGGAGFSGMRFCWQVFRCDRVHAYSGMKLGRG